MSRRGASDPPPRGRREEAGVRNPFEGPKLFSPSFLDALRAYAPELLEPPTGAGALPETPHATTVAAMRYADGVVMAGDRRSTEGLTIAQRDIEKVLEHYEKIEGFPLSLEGKANKLGQMVRGNLGLAMQGLVVVPLFAGYDARRRTGRIFRYDVTGGRWEDEDYYATGSGGTHARGSLKKRYRHGMDGAAAVDAIVEALYDAADEDAATGGPDLVRGIFPVVATVTAEGYLRLPDAEVRKAAERVVDARARGEG
jgi:proteasome beta subunit